MTTEASIWLTVVCAAVSFALGFVYFKFKNPILRLACHLGVPIVLGMSAYWIWNWHCMNEPAYKGWDVIFTMQVMVVAIPASTIAAIMSMMMQKWINRHRAGQ